MPGAATGMFPWLQAAGTQAVRLRVHAVPRASRTAFAGVHGEALKVKLAAPPADGAANTELLAFLARTLELPRSQVVLVAGASSREKTVMLSGVSLAAAQALLAPVVTAR